MTQLRRVIAVDPGGTCGLAIGYAGEGAKGALVPREYSPMTCLEAVERLLASDNPQADTLLVVEKFTIDRRTLTLTRQGVQDTIDTVGALKWLAHKHGAEWDNTQGPGDVKPLITDARLRALGWYMSTSGGHANDASRHLAYAMARRKMLELPV